MRASMLALAITALLVGAVNDIEVVPYAEKPGAVVCAFPIHITIEGHLWVSHLYRTAKRDCIFYVRKLPNREWQLLPTDIPLKRGTETDHEDSLFLGWFRIEGWNK